MSTIAAESLMLTPHPVTARELVYDNRLPQYAWGGCGGFVRSQFPTTNPIVPDEFGFIAGSEYQRSRSAGLHAAGFLVEIGPSALVRGCWHMDLGDGR